MSVSVFTPSHDPRWLDDAAETLLAQTHQDWEWVVLLNGGASWTPRSRDPRIRVRATGMVSGIGDAKRQAVALTTGAVLVELDHDDLLLPNALASVMGSLARHPDSRFVYSDFAEMTAEGGRREARFDAGHGWNYSDFPMGDQAMDRCHAMAPLPHNVSLIWYAPNHLRAFTRGLYDEVGGYDAALTILDDQDLMCRMFERTAFARLDECLYLQRRHPSNSQSLAGLNARIQDQTSVMADGWLERLTSAWAAREGLAVVDLSSAGQPLHIDADDGSVGVVQAAERPYTVHGGAADLDEMHRVLAHGGLARLSPGGWADVAGARFRVVGRPVPVSGGRPHHVGPAHHTDLVAVKDGDRLGGVPRD